MASGASLGKATIDLELEYAKVSKALDVVNKRIGRFESKMKKASNRLKAVFSIGAVVAFGSAVKKTFDELDKIGKVADKLGITTTKLQELRFAAEQTGVASNTLDTAVQRFTRRLGEAVEGTGVLKDDLEKLNISIRNSDGSTRDAMDVLNEYADAMSNAADPSEKLRLSIAAFDTEGGALVNTFAKGSKGIQAFADELRAAGGVIDESLVRDAESANDAMNLLGKSLNNLMVTVIAPLAPLIEKVSLQIMKLVKLIQTSKDDIAAWFDAWVGGFADVLKMSGAHWRYLIGGAVDAKEAVNDVFKGLSAPELDTMIQGSIAQISRLRQAIIDLRNTKVVGANGAVVGGSFDTAFQKSLDDVKLLESALNSEKKYLAELQVAFSNLSGGIASFNEQGVLTIDMFEGMTETLEEAAVVGTNLGDVFAGMMSDGVKTFADEVSAVNELMLKHGFALEDVSKDEMRLKRLLDAGKISWDEYGDAMGLSSEIVRETTDSMFDLGEAMNQVQNNLQSSFSGLFENILSGERDSFKTFAKDVLGIFKKLLADMAAAWVSKKIFGGFFSGAGGGFDFGSVFSGSGKMFSGSGKMFSGGGGGGGGLGQLGTTISKSVMNGFKGLKGLFSGGGSYAPAGGMAGSGGGAGFSMAGAAIPLAIGAFGMARFAKSKQQKQDANVQFGSMNTGINEALNQVSSFRGQLNGDDFGEFFITLNEGWTSTIQALKEANLIVESQGALYDENGNQLIKMKGNVDGVRDALAGAAITGHTLNSSFAEANSSSGDMRVSVVGDFEAIKTSIQAAGAIGVGTFKNIQKTATGASVSVQGDLRKWKTYLDGAIGVAISNVTNDLGSTVNQAEALTNAFKDAARAASQIRSPSGSSSGMQRFASGGIAHKPSIFGEAGPEAAVPLPDGRNIPVVIKGGMSDEETNSLLRKLIKAVERSNMSGFAKA